MKTEKAAAGSKDRLGATLLEDGINFAVYSETASALWVSIYDEFDNETGRYELDGHEDNIHFGKIEGVAAGTRYGLRADGPYDVDQGFHFDPNKLLVDPYARRLDRPFVRSPSLRLAARGCRRYGAAGAQGHRRDARADAAEAQAQCPVAAALL